MKSKYYAAALLAMSAPFAAAQSSVTLYGVADIGLEYINHANAGGNSLTRMTSG
ncbi:MAG: porin, partial [Longimicrobiales bacterium]